MEPDGRLKNEYDLSQLRVRGLERLQLHAGLTHRGAPCFALIRNQEVVLAA